MQAEGHTPTEELVAREKSLQHVAAMAMPPVVRYLLLLVEEK